MRTVCFIQCHYTDLQKDLNGRSHLKEPFYCINRIKKSELFDTIFLAAADIPENRAIQDLAEKYRISCYLGSIYNVAKRMREVARISKADILVRLLLTDFLVDVDLIKGMIERIKHERADYVSLPQNFDIRFGADVLTRDCSEKLVVQFEGDKAAAEKFKFRPWFFMKNNPGVFRTVTYEDVPSYSDEGIIKKLNTWAKKAWPERFTYGKWFPYDAYQFACNYISSDDRVLDVGCGCGDGTYLLSKVARSVVGADRDPAVIKIAQKQHQGENLNFEVGDAEDITFEKESFDKVLCIHLMEHLNSEQALLRGITNVLKRGGLLILEVPLLMRYPVGKTWILSHVREYTVDQLGAVLARSGLTVMELRGVYRGIYCEASKAWESAMAICRK